MKQTKKAFKWIVAILKKHRVPFQITGGLAAKVYGSPRELADIDIDIPESKFKKILPDVKDYVIFGPKRYRDESFNVLLMTIRYKGQDIDVAGAYTIKIFDKNKKQWVKEKTILSRYENKQFFGLTGPVITRKDLIKYKSKLLRKEDKIDIKAILKHKKPAFQ